MKQEREKGPQSEPRGLVPWIAYLIFFAVLNETMFNVSTPKIAASFALTPSGVSWMMTIFMVLFGIGGVIFGKLSDIYGLRSLIRAGVGIYVGASLVGFALRAFYPAVLAARALQGLGGSAIPALVFVVIARRFEASERGKVFGLITSVVSLAIGFGPVIGGFVSSAIGWHFLFLIPVPILASLPFLGRILGPEARRHGAVDIPGAILAAAAIGSLVAFLNLGAWPFLALFAAAFAALLVRIRTAANPFIEPRLFANRGFRNGLGAAFSLFAIFLGLVFLVPIMLNRVHALDTAAIGLILFPGAISSVFFGPVAGRIADRRGSSPVVAAGLILIVSGMLSMAVLQALSPFVVAAAMLLTYVGFALFQTAMVNAISQTLPPDEMGVGMGLFNLVGILSGAIGTTIVGRILDSGLLGFRIPGLSGSASSFAYDNVLLAFAVLASLCGIAYLRSLRRPSARLAIGPAGPMIEGECLEAGC